MTKFDSKLFGTNFASLTTKSGMTYYVNQPVAYTVGDVQDPFIDRHHTLNLSIEQAGIDYKDGQFTENDVLMYMEQHEKDKHRFYSPKEIIKQCLKGLNGDVLTGEVAAINSVSGGFVVSIEINEAQSKLLNYGEEQEQRLFISMDDVKLMQSSFM